MKDSLLDLKYLFVSFSTLVSSKRQRNVQSVAI